MKKILFVLLFIGITDLYSQSPGWHVLPTGPIADPSALRFDDVFFINQNTGGLLLPGFQM